MASSRLLWEPEIGMVWHGQGGTGPQPRASKAVACTRLLEKSGIPGPGIRGHTGLEVEAGREQQDRLPGYTLAPAPGAGPVRPVLERAGNLARQSHPAALKTQEAFCLLVCILKICGHCP